MIDQNGMGDGEIHAAAISGDLTKLKSLISIDRSLVQANGWHGTKPLHYAVRGHLDCVKFLVANGADVNAKSVVHKTTAIFEASTEEIAQFLVKKGARVDIIGSSGRVPLDYAIQGKHVEVVQFLIDCGVDVNYLDGSGFHTMMQWALTEIFLTEEQSGYSEIVEISRQIIEMLLKAGGDINQRNSSGDTVMNIAVQRKYKSIVKLLLSYGADPCIRNAWGTSCFDLTDDESTLALLSPYKANLVEIYKKQDDFETLIERLIATRESTRNQFMPCTEEEIINLEISHGVKLPEEYKKFLRVMGHGAGSFLISDHWSAFMESFDDFLGKHFFECEDDDDNQESIKQPENFFVFASRMGDNNLGFFADGLNKDPEIYEIDYDGNVKKCYDSFWGFIQEMVEYYEFYQNPKRFTQQFEERFTQQNTNIDLPVKTQKNINDSGISISADKAIDNIENKPWWQFWD